MAGYEGQERRRDPRVARRLTLTIADAREPVTTETKNVSRSGILCEVDRPIPLMEKVQISLELPGRFGASRRITCDGVVVRQERLPSNNGRPARYELAIFFTRMSPQHRRYLEEYVSDALAQ